MTQEYLESNTLPSWSPDGKYLAYLSDRLAPFHGTGSAHTVLVIRSAETNQLVRELRVKLSNLYSYLWTPDGRFLLLQGRDFKGRWGTYRMDAQTGDLSPFIFHEREDLAYPSLSSDGKSLYFRRLIPGAKEYALIQRDLDSGNEKELIRRAVLGGAVVSPDGQYVGTFSTDPSTNSRTLLLVPTAGGEPREMMRVPAEVESRDLSNFPKGQWLIGPRWGPDSRSFLVVKRFNGIDPEVWGVSLDGAGPTKLDLKLGRINNWMVHPDGRRIVFADKEEGSPRKQEVWVLENFLPATTSASK